MPDSMVQPTMKPPTRWKWLFLVWVGAGVLLMSLSSFARWMCPSLPAAYLTFQFVAVDPSERSAEREQIDDFVGWVAVLRKLEDGAYAYALVGLLVFYRRGCVVLLIAGFVAVWCWWNVTEVACMSL